jgi:TetR/AcrR family transcriptional regulator
VEPSAATVGAVGEGAMSGRRGRPRRDSRPVNGRPRDEVLAVATRAFGERGYAAVTMREIAETAGLHPTSLYYYFRSKEEILGAVVAEANRFSLDHLTRVRVDGTAPAVDLYRVVHFDVRALCGLPYDIGDVLRLAALRDDRFTRYWDDRRALHDGVESLVVAGVADGSLREVDARLASLTLLSNDEAVRNWYERAELDDGRYTPETIATFVADLGVGSLLADRRRLPAVRRAALELERPDDDRHVDSR